MPLLICLKIKIPLVHVQELDEPEYNHFFVKRLVTRAMDKHNHEREMASILLSALHGEVRPGNAHLVDTGAVLIGVFHAW